MTQLAYLPNPFLHEPTSLAPGFARSPGSIGTNWACTNSNTWWSSWRESMWRFPKMGYGAPQNGWFIMDNTIEMDDNWVPPWLRKPPCGSKDRFSHGFMKIARDARLQHGLQINNSPLCSDQKSQPWCWNIYQHLPWKSASFVGKYTSTMVRIWDPAVDDT